MDSHHLSLRDGPHHRRTEARRRDLVQKSERVTVTEKPMMDRIVIAIGGGAVLAMIAVTAACSTESTSPDESSTTSTTTTTTTTSETPLSPTENAPNPNAPHSPFTPPVHAPQPTLDQDRDDYGH